MARKGMPIANTLTTDESGRVYLFMSIDSTGAVRQDRDCFTVVDEGSGVYKITINHRVAITQEMLDDTSSAANAYGTGVTQTCAISTTTYADLDSATGTIAVVSPPSIDDDGLIYFYVELVSSTGDVGVYIRVIISTLYKNVARS